MASLPYPLNWLYNHGRVGMAGMPYPPTDCRSYIKINMNTYLIIEFVSLITAEAGDLRHDIYVIYSLIFLSFCNYLLPLSAR